MVDGVAFVEPVENRYDDVIRWKDELCLEREEQVEVFT